MIWLTYALIPLALLGAAWWTIRPHNPTRCRDCQAIQRRIEQRRRAMDQWGSSPTTNSAPYSVRLAGPSISGVKPQRWSSVSLEEVRAHSGTQVDLLASSSSTLPRGSDTPGRTPNSGPTPLSTAGQPTPSTSTTSGGGTNRSGSGRASRSGYLTPFATGYGDEGYQGDDDASYDQVLGGRND